MEENTSLNSMDFLPTSYHGKNILKRLNNQEKHSELFRKDLISAMKMADSETLQPDDYLEIIDSWKLEWERGVQVPVNANAFVPIIRDIQEDVKTEDSDQESYIFSKKLLYSGSVLDDSFKPLIHEPYDLQKEVGSMCRYDLDELDLTWLQLFNQSQDGIGERNLSELEMERVMEELEVQCNAKMNEAVRTVEGLGIEYDENVVCDICRSPEGEESNEMVFCDNCDICVHQACYGIQKIPDGSWLCRTCALGIKPKCALCPMAGGAMKSTKNGDKWAHISCALWVPEVSIGCPEKMEPITNLTQIPASRWALICTLCRERSGACIQCSVKSCKTSFHVTCAFKYTLDLSTVIDEETEDVQMKAYCPKHSGIEGAGIAGSNMFSGGCDEDDVGHEGKVKDGCGPDRKSKRNKDGLTEEQRTEIRSLKLRRLAEEFYKFADAREVSRNLKLPLDVVNPLLSYWTLKRKSRFDCALMPVKTADEEEEPELHQGEEKLIERMKMFIQLRQDLERVRNLCYMVNKREKTRRHLYRIKEEIFHRQALLYTKLIDDYDDDMNRTTEGAANGESLFSLTNGNKTSESNFAVISQPAFELANGSRPLTDNSFKNFSKKQNFRLSDSDDDDDDDEEEYSRILKKVVPTHEGSIGFQNRVSKCLRINYSDDDDDDDYTFGTNFKNFSDDDGTRKVNGRQEEKKKMSKDKQEEKDFLLTAHRSTGTVYDQPSYILSCSFKDNSVLNMDRSFMKSATAASTTSIFGVDDDDDEEIFPKSFKYDMKIDDDYVDSISSTPVVTKPGRGRPRKNKRPPQPLPPAPPPPSLSQPSVVEFEEDDSDYYRRLSDEDFEEELLKFTPVKPVKTPPEPPAPPVEKKKRGRKRKSDLVPASSTAPISTAEKNKSNRRQCNQTPSTEPIRKRKYTRRKKMTETSKDNKNVYTPSLTSSPTLQSFQDDSNNFEVSVDSENHVKDGNCSPAADNNNSDNDNVCRKRDELSAGISCNFSDEEDEETRARRSRAAELLKDMEMSDSCTEEETVCNVIKPDVDVDAENPRSPRYDSIICDDENFEIKSICSVVACDQSPDVLEMTLSPVELESFNPEKEDNECPVDDTLTVETVASAPSTPHPVTVEEAPLLTSFSLNLPSSPLFSSSSSDDDESDNDFLGDRSIKNDSKVTGVINKELLNINAKRKLLHELPVKDFIVSSHIKNMVQNFFSNLGSTAIAAAATAIARAPDAGADCVAPKLAFNGFKIPQGKINC